MDLYIKTIVNDKQLDELDKKLKDIERSASGLNNPLDLMKGKLSNLTNLTGGLGSKFTMVATAAASVTAVLVGVVELHKALFAQAQKYNSEIKTMKNNFGGMNEEGYKLLDTIKATEDISDKELGKAVTSVKNTFGVSTNEALKYIESLQAQGVSIEENVDQLNEYAIQAKESGASISQFFATFKVAKEAGVYTDKLIDSMKSANVTSGNLTPGVQAALKGIGVEADTLSKNVFTMSKQLEEAFDRSGVSAAKRSEILKGIFEAPGEDVGHSRLLKLIGEVSKGMDANVTATTTAMNTMNVAEEKLSRSWNAMWASMSDNGKWYEATIKGYANTLNLLSTALDKVAAARRWIGMKLGIDEKEFNLEDYKITEDAYKQKVRGLARIMKAAEKEQNHVSKSNLEASIEKMREEVTYHKMFLDEKAKLDKEAADAKLKELETLRNAEKGYDREKADKAKKERDEKIKKAKEFQKELERKQDERDKAREKKLQGMGLEKFDTKLAVPYSIWSPDKIQETPEAELRGGISGVKQVTINIGKQVETMNINTTSQESPYKLKDNILDLLNTAIAEAASIA